MSPIFITGGSGLLALNWAYLMRDRDLVILGLHRRKVFLGGVRQVRVNLTSANELSHFLKYANIRTLIHTAGLTSVEECEMYPTLAHQLNVSLASNIAKVCAELSIKLIHVSTDHLFLGNEAFLREEQVISPINEYGKTKGLAELEVLKHNPNALIIRTNFYGWGTSYRRSFSDFIIDSLRRDGSIALFEDVFFTPISIEFLVGAVTELTNLGVAGVVNVVGDQRLSKFEFGRLVAEIFNLPIMGVTPSMLSKQRHLVQRPADMSLSNAKIVSLLGRRMGTVRDHLIGLRQQSITGCSKEMANL